MSLEQLPNRDTTQEREPQAKVLSTTHGYIHDPLNLQGIPEVLDTFARHLEMHEGKKVFYLEESGLSPEEAITAVSRINKQGFRGVLLEHLLSDAWQIPQNNEIVDLSYRIEQTNHDVKKILDLGLLPVDQIQHYFLYMGLDQLRAKHNFDLVFETHSQEVLRRDKELIIRFSTAMAEAKDKWDKRDFDNCLLDTKNAYYLAFQDDLLREQDMIKQQGDILESLLGQEKGGSLFALVGEAHLPITETIHENLGHQAQVRYKRNIGVYENLQDRKIDAGLRSGDLASDETYVQSSMVGLVMPELVRNSIELGTISTLANNYQSYSKIVRTIASSIPLEKGRELCKKKIPLFGFFLKQWDSV